MSLASLWRGVTPAGQRHESLSGDAVADAVVVGAGYTGLSAAWHLAGDGLDVVVLEACDVGSGASGLNNGQVIPVLTRADPDMLIDRFAGAGERFVRLIGGSAQDLFDLVRQEGLECEAEQSGWIQPAHSPGRVRAVSQSRFRQWRRNGAAVELLDKAAVDGLLGTGFYHGGMLHRSGGHINPLALARELARIASERSVRLFENTPGLGISRQPDGWRVATIRGHVRAKALVLATNAYTGERAAGLASNMARTILPIRSWQMATQPLPDDVRATIVPGRQAVSDTQGDLHFFRYDARHRLVTGGALALPHDAEARLKQHIGRRLKKLFPQIGEPRFEYVWNGYIGKTRDHTPHVHRLGPDGWAWVGCNGRGVALSVAMGRELARAVGGAATSDLPFPVTEVEPLPLHGLLRLFAPPLTLSLYRRRDRREVPSQTG